MDQIEKLIIKKWDGSASKEELERLNSLFLNLSDKEKQAYQNLEIYWKSEGRDTPKVNQVQLWNRLEAFIDDKGNGTQKPKGIVIPFINVKIFSVAASIIFLVMAGYLLWNEMPFYLPEQTAQVEKVKLLEKSNEAGQKSTLKLPDGSVVILNSKSKLFVPEKFTQENRVVELVGEAYFDIVSNPSKPFIVKTNNAEVKVLGTAFNLKNNSTQDEVILNVVEGKVQFSGNSKEENLFVTAHEAAVLDVATGQLKPVSFDQDAIAWSKGELVFNSTSFQEIISMLESWYGVKIETKRNFILQNGFTGRYKNASLEDVLTGISFSVAFDFEINGKEVVIR